MVAGRRPQAEKSDDVNLKEQNDGQRMFRKSTALHSAALLAPRSCAVPQLHHCQVLHQRGHGRPTAAGSGLAVQDHACHSIHEHAAAHKQARASMRLWCQAHSEEHISAEGLGWTSKEWRGAAQRIQKRSRARRESPERRRTASGGTSCAHVCSHEVSLLCGQLHAGWVARDQQQQVGREVADLHTAIAQDLRQCGRAHCSPA